MIDTKVKVNGKTVGEYDLINEPYVKRVNGESPDDHGNVVVESGGGPTINGGYDIKELVTVTDETIAPNQEEFSERTSVVSQLFNNVGETIHVTYDGVMYECLVKGSLGRCIIGDSTFTEYPFFYENNTTLDVVNPLSVSDPTISHTIKIEAYKKTPVVFDRKYIPDLQTLTDSLVFMNGRFLVVDSDGIPKWTAFKDVPVDYVTIKSSTSGSSKKFKITVDDSGTISATEITE